MFSILQTISLIFRSNLPHGCCRHRSAIEWVNLRVNGIQKTHLKIPSAISLHAEKESVLVMWMFTIVYIFFVLASWAALFPFFVVVVDCLLYFYIYSTQTVKNARYKCEKRWKTKLSTHAIPFFLVVFWTWFSHSNDVFHL